RTAKVQGHERFDRYPVHGLEGSLCLQRRGEGLNLTPRSESDNRTQSLHRRPVASPVTARGSGARLRLRPLPGGKRDEQEARVQMALDGTTETLRGAARADRSSLQDALDGIRDDLGFDTASLFVSAPAGWRLLERRGPTQP